MPEVSVIIPNYNHAPFLRERIDSVLNQTYSDFEVIILDDCSTDNSREIIETYRGHEKITHIEYNTVNSGSTFKQWEKGIKLAKGEWIWIAESDDVAEPDFLKKIIEHSQENPNMSIAYCASNLIDEHGKKLNISGSNQAPDSQIHSKFKLSFSEKGNDFIASNMILENSIPNASAVIFRNNKAQTSILDEIKNLKLNGDWIFWIEVLKQGDIRFINETLNNFRHHNTSVRNSSRLSFLNIQEYIYVMDRLSYDEKIKTKSADRLLFLMNTTNAPSKIKIKIYWELIKRGKWKQTLKACLKKAV